MELLDKMNKSKGKESPNLFKKISRVILPIAIGVTMTVSGVMGFANYAHATQVDCDDEKCGFNYTMDGKSFHVKRDCPSKEDEADYSEIPEETKKPILNCATISKIIPPKTAFFIECSKAGPDYKAVSMNNIFDKKVIGIVDTREEYNGCIFYNKSRHIGFQADCNCCGIE